MAFSTAEPAPSPKVPLTARSFRRHLVAGRGMLLDAARLQRLGGTYRDADRQPTDAQARKVLAALVVDGREELRLLAEGLEDERLSLARWHRMTRDNVIARHVAAALATKGSTRLDADEAESLRIAINDQLGFLDRFRDEVRSGDQLLGDGSAHRATLYADAAWATGMNAGLDRAIVRGATEGLRVLGSSDHCLTCLSEAAAGWRPIRSIRRIGDSECGVMCHCTLRVR